MNDPYMYVHSIYPSKIRGYTCHINLNVIEKRTHVYLYVSNLLSITHKFTKPSTFEFMSKRKATPTDLLQLLKYFNKKVNTCNIYLNLYASINDIFLYTILTLTRAFVL